MSLREPLVNTVADTSEQCEPAGSSTGQPHSNPNSWRKVGTMGKKTMSSGSLADADKSGKSADRSHTGKGVDGSITSLWETGGSTFDEWLDSSGQVYRTYRAYSGGGLTMASGPASHSTARARDGA